MLSARSLLPDFRWDDFVHQWTAIATAIEADFPEVCAECDGDGYAIEDGWRNGRHVDVKHRCRCAAAGDDYEPTYRQLGWLCPWGPQC